MIELYTVERGRRVVRENRERTTTFASLPDARSHFRKAQIKDAQLEMFGKCNQDWCKEPKWGPKASYCLNHKP